jgi:hypothetical protein
MPTIQVRTELSPDDLLQAVGQLNSPELDDFVQRVLLLRAGRVSRSLGQEETALLRRINDAFPPGLMSRQQELIRRRDARTISPEELEELIRLTDQIEGLQAERVGALIELGQLRQTTLDQVMRELGIGPISEAHG